MKTKRELAQEQLDLMNDIRAKANINMVTCGHCGTILLHEMKLINEDNTIVCFDCKTEWTDLCDCPDYWYEGCIHNVEFDEEEVKLPVTIKASDFIKWYLSGSDDTEQLGRRVAQGLTDSGTYKIDVKELFDECGYIPASICNNVPEDKEDDEYDPSEVEFIDDLF